jgi:uncharacterized membrane protein
LTGVKSNSELRAMAREQLRGHWGIAIGTVVIFLVISGIISSVTNIKDYRWILTIILLLITGAWQAGILAFFLNLIRSKPLSIKDLFSQLPRLIPFFLLYLLVGIFILLWTLLLIIPGIIAALRYNLAFYIMVDHPEIGALEAINRSKEMMRGQKWKYFKLLLSFIGWYLLCIITLGIGFLWLIPYIYATQAAFYEDLREQYNALYQTLTPFA